MSTAGLCSSTVAAKVPASSQADCSESPGEDEDGAENPTLVPATSVKGFMFRVRFRF